MAKKPGLMNDDKNMGSMDPMKVANVMAHAAHIKVQKMGKPYMENDDSDGNGDDNTGHPNKSVGKNMDNPGKDGAKHPTAPSSTPSKYSNEQHDEMSGGSDHPSKKKSGKQVAALKSKMAAKGQSTYNE